MPTLHSIGAHVALLISMITYLLGPTVSGQDTDPPIFISSSKSPGVMVSGFES